MEDYRKIAIELGQTLINKAPETREDVERMLPELKESEDENIRKEIIIYLKSVISNKKFGDEIIESWIDWLEKQGEQKTTKIEVNAGELSDFERSLKHIIEEAIEDGDTHNLKADADMLLRIAHKSAWSEDDEKLALSIEQIFNCASLLNIVPDKIEKVKSWLKNLKNRVQPKQEWSEEDANLLDNCISLIEDMPGTENEQNWLKSLKPQSQWKPSDEQIKVCKEVYAGILSAKGFDLGTVNSELNRLEEELKKLR